MARPTLDAALDSIAAQDYDNVEILLVAACGASHAAPPRQCGRFALRFVASDVPLSRPIAANAGLDAASGDYVTFLDDDDAIAPDHLSGLVGACAEANDAGVIHAYARAVFRDGRTE